MIDMTEVQEACNQALSQVNSSSQSLGNGQAYVGDTVSATLTDGYPWGGQSFGGTLGNLNTGVSYSYCATYDKTEKAIKIVKLLMEDKLIDLKSISKFLELVEKVKCNL